MVYIYFTFADFIASPSPLWATLGFELGWSWLDWVGVCPGGFGDKGLGTRA